VSSTSSVTLPLVVRDLQADDVEKLGWSGPPAHLRAIRSALARRDAGEVDYLAVCARADLPLAVGGVDYGHRAGTGTLWQLAVLPGLQSCGLGTVLIGALEERARRRGKARVDLGVGEDNPRARALYERLGYRPCGSEVDRWTYEREDGTTGVHEQLCALLGKEL
jgi:ribosomal protein S18 acetylase RimI-like enzyme